MVHLEIFWLNQRDLIDISAYETFICCQWNNLFNSMIWMTTESKKVSDIESIKILFEPI